MGTSAYIVMRVKQSDGSYKTWFMLYLHSDGGQKGYDLCKMLARKKLAGCVPMGCNSLDEKERKEARRRWTRDASCLFAQIISLFKGTDPPLV